MNLMLFIYVKIILNPEEERLIPLDLKQKKRSIKKKYKRLHTLTEMRIILLKFR